MAPTHMLIRGAILLDLAVTCGCARTAERQTSARQLLPPPAREFRGLWIARWDFADPLDLERLVDRAARAGFTAILFQVRGQGAVLYPSRLEPWSAELSGALGRDPGYDPLRVALDAAHRRGLELHAWVNAMPMWRGDQPPPETVPRHVLLAHPEWVARDPNGDPMLLGGPDYVCMAPGNPAARAHVVAVLEEMAQGYELDGLHLDYIRSCGPEFSHDAVSEARFAEARARDPALSWEQFQRDQVTALVREAHAVAVRHGLRLSAAVWHNNNLDVPGSRGYRDYYQDSHAWTREGIVDALMPMNYLRLDSEHSFAPRARDHVAHAFGHDIVMGVHALGRITEPDPSGDRMLENIAYARQVGASGFAVFSAGLLESDHLWGALERAAWEM